MKVTSKGNFILNSDEFKSNISSLTVDDFKVLSDMATYLLSIKAKKSVSCFHSGVKSEFFLSSEPLIFSIRDLEVLKKLKHLHFLKFRENGKK